MYHNNKATIEIVQKIESYQLKKSSLSLAARNKVINKSASNYISNNKEIYGPCFKSGKLNYDNCHCSSEELDRQLKIIRNMNALQEINKDSSPTFKLKITVQGMDFLGKGTTSTFSDTFYSPEVALASASDLREGRGWKSESWDAGWLGSKTRWTATKKIEEAVNKHKEGQKVDGWIKVKGTLYGSSNCSSNF